MSFCGLTKVISPKICILCVCVKINKHLFEPFCVWIQWKAEKGLVCEILILLFHVPALFLMSLIQTAGLKMAALIVIFHHFQTSTSNKKDEKSSKKLLCLFYSILTDSDRACVVSSVQFPFNSGWHWQYNILYHICHDNHSQHHPKAVIVTPI